MDGSLRIQQAETYSPINRVNARGDRKPGKRFDPEALLADESAEQAAGDSEELHTTPVGHKLDDESGSTLDLTA